MRIGIHDPSDTTIEYQQEVDGILMKSRTVGRIGRDQRVGTRVQIKHSMSLFELILVGVGGIIGAGYFLGSGQPIRMAGPAVLLAFAIGGAITAQTVGALNTLALDHPSPGAFKTYADAYLGKFTGYMQGWTYYITSILTIASEAVASAVFARLWLPGVPVWMLAAAFALIVLAINAFGVQNFGLVESVMSVVKIAALVGFIVTITIVLFGAHPATMGRMISGPSASLFPNGFTGLAQSMLIVIFCFAGIGVFGTAAIELKEPKHLDRGGIAVVTILTGLYILSIAALLLTLPYRTVSTTASPFVQALMAAHLHTLASILNAVILIASFSVMAGSVFSANQILVSLGRYREAPAFVKRTFGKRAVAYGALAFTTVGVAICIALSYVLPSTVYTFLISASSFLTFFNWFIMLLTLLAWKRKNKDKPISKLAFGQPVGTYVTMALIVVMAGYALVEKSQRLGFFACLGIAAVIAIAYLFVRKHVHSPEA